MPLALKILLIDFFTIATAFLARGLFSSWTTRPFIILRESSKCALRRVLDSYTCRHIRLTLTRLRRLFAKMKAFIRRKWPIYQDEPDHDFGAFLERCIDTVGAKNQSARGHFRHAGIMIEATPLESTEL
jgi:hypothetical protein